MTSTPNTDAHAALEIAETLVEQGAISEQQYLTLVGAMQVAHASTTAATAAAADREDDVVDMDEQDDEDDEDEALAALAVPREPYVRRDVVVFTNGVYYDAAQARFRTLEHDDEDAVASVYVPYPAPVASRPAHRARLVALLSELVPDPDVLLWRVGLLARGLTGGQAGPILLLTLGRSDSCIPLLLDLADRAWGRNLSHTLFAADVASLFGSAAVRPNHELCNLQHRRHVVVRGADPETVASGRFPRAEDVKQLLGGGSLVARRRYEHPTQFCLQFPVLELPVHALPDGTLPARSTPLRDQGVLRRLRVWHVQTDMPSDDRVGELLGLAPELMAWMVELHQAACAEGGEWPPCPPQVEAWTQAFLGPPSSPRV